MNIISRGRRSGKTHDLIITSNVTNLPILCYSINRCENIKKMAEKMERKIPEPINISDWMEYKRFHKVPPIIDDAEAIVETALESFLGVAPIAIAITDNDKESRILGCVNKEEF